MKRTLAGSLLPLCVIAWCAMSLMFLAAPKLIDASLSFGPTRPLVLGSAAYFGDWASPDCSLIDCIRAIRNKDRESRRAEELARMCRVIRTTETAKLIATPYGQYWLPRSEHIGGLVGNFIERKKDVYKTSRIRPGDVVLDCGANVGAFTRLALDRGAGLVVAIEPAPANVECLRATFAEEIAAGRVIVYPFGVWDTEEAKTMNVVTEGSGLNSLVLSSPYETSHIQIRLTTIDQLVSDLKLARVDFIKMDIEGAERQALRGGRTTIARFQPHLAVALEHLPTDATELPGYIRELWPEMRTATSPATFVMLPNLQRIQPDVVWADAHPVE